MAISRELLAEKRPWYIGSALYMIWLSSRVTTRTSRCFTTHGETQMSHDSATRTLSFVTWWRHQLEIFSTFLVFVRGLHRSPMNSPHKGQWRGALVFSVICAWTNGWVNNREASDVRRHHAHYDVTVIEYNKHAHGRGYHLLFTTAFQSICNHHNGQNRLIAHLKCCFYALFLWKLVIKRHCLSIPFCVPLWYYIEN